MDMKDESKLTIHLNDLNDDDPKRIAGRIRAADSRVTITFTVLYTYIASSKAELVNSWLKVWYLAETIGELGKIRSYTVNEIRDGAAFLTLDIQPNDPLVFSKALHELAPALDPDDLESEFWLSETANDWLGKRPADASTHFASLEKAYRDDAAEAYE